MGAEADAGTIVLRILADNASALRGVNAQIKAHDKLVKSFEKVAAVANKSASAQSKFPSALELSNKRHEAAIKEREALNKRMEASMKASAEFMRFSRPNYPRPPTMTKVRYPAHYWTGAAGVGQTDLRSPQARLARHNARIAQREADKAARFVRPRGKYGPPKPSAPYVHPLAAGMSQGSQVHSMAAMMATARHIPQVYGKAVFPKGKYGPPVPPGFTPPIGQFQQFRNGLNFVGGAAWGGGGAIIGVFRKISSSISDSIGNLQAFGTKLRTAGLYATALLTAPLLGLGREAVAQGGGFDKALVEASARAGYDAQGNRKIGSYGVAGSLREQMEQTALNLSTSGKTSFNPVEIAKGYQELAAAGVEAVALMGAIPIVTALAQAGELDMAKATNDLTTTMGALGITTDTMLAKFGNVQGPMQYAREMSKFSDVMVTVANLTQASVESVAQSMTTDAGPAARAYGMDIQQLGALIGVYAEKGIKGARAGNMAGRALRLVTSSFTKKQDVWESLGINIADSQGNWKPFVEVMDILSSKLQGLSGLQRVQLLDKLGLRTLSQKAIEPLMGTTAAYQKLLHEMRIGGATEEMAAIQMEAFTNRVKAAWNSLYKVGIDVFNILRPYLESFAKALASLAEMFVGLSKETKLSIIIIAGALALIGPILLLVGTAVAIAVAGLSMLVGIFSSLSGFLVAGGVILVGFSLLESAMKNAFQVDFISFWDDLTGSMMKFATNIPGFLENFKQNMGTLFKWLSTQDLGAIIKIPLGIIGTTLVGIMTVVGRELLVAMIPIGKFFWELFQGLVLYMRDSLMGMSFNPVTGFSWANRSQQAHDTYTQEVAQSEMTRKSAAGLVLGANWGLASKDSVEKARIGAENDHKYRVATALAKRDARLNEVNSGELLIGKLFNTALGQNPDPLQAIGAILGNAGTELSNSFRGLNLPDFNYETIKVDAKSAHDARAKELRSINAADVEAEYHNEDGLTDTQRQSLGLGKKKKKKKGKLGYGAENEKIEGVEFGSAEAYSRIMSYAQGSGAMMPIERKVDTAEQKQTEIIKLLEIIAKNTMGESVIFNTTNFADA